jgi:quinoprotein glucose dehydrogenase
MKLWGAALALAATIAVAAQDRQPAAVEWRYWGGDPGQTRYSPVGEITRANVQNLELAWRWQTIDRAMPEHDMRPGGFENTPLMVDGAVYVSTSFHRVVALDAETGAERWRFDPRTYEEGPPLSATGLNSRGVVHWRGEDGSSRIFIAGRQRLFSVDAVTGQLDKAFGSGGVAALNQDLGREVPRLHTQATSPPVIYRNLVIVGSGVPDRLQYRSDPPGTVQAFDVRTGKRAWIFFTIPQSASDFGADTWGSQSWRSAGHANVWAPMALDEARGLLYVPTTTPSGDYWGGWRPGANLFAESLICLDAATGARKWHFQAVHHGLWDYDLASPPMLVTIRPGGRTIDAVAQLSKQGFTYVFDRVTGEPVWPIEERPVDTTSDVPGEQVYPTQPFPTKPPPLGPQGISLADANDLTPEIKALAEEQLKRFRLGPLFTPPSLGGTVQRPSQVGAANWGGGAFDPASGRLFVKVGDSYHVSSICRNDQQDSYVTWEYGNYCGQYGLFAFRGGQNPRQAPSAATPTTKTPDTVYWSGGKLAGLPLTKPPYAYLVAVDLNQGEIAWRVPFGEGSQVIRQHPLLKGVTLPDRLGTDGRPGPIVTSAGLVFIGGGDPYLYVFDAATGQELRRVATPFRTSGNPMTYRTRSGRQFVLVATGGGPDATLAAFALRDNRTTGSFSTSQVVRTTAAMPPEAAFARVCQSCHGPAGTGGFAPSLVPMTRSAAEVLAIVREGIGQMPPVSAGELTDEEVRAVYEYLRAGGGSRR